MFLSRNALSLSLKNGKIAKRMKKIHQKWEKSYLYGWSCQGTLKRAGGRLSVRLENLPLAIEKLSCVPYPLQMKDYA